MVKKMFRLEVDVDESYVVMLEYLRRFYQIRKRRELLELVILDAVLDVASLPPPKGMTAKQKEGYAWCCEMAIKYTKPMQRLLQKRKIDSGKICKKTKKDKRRRPQKRN